MPTELVRRINLDLLYPPFLDRFLGVIAECQSRGARYYAQLGTRTFAEQAKLYFQGRTAPGPRVTNAPAGFSLHNYGIAVDVVRDADLASVGLQPYWAADGYETLADVGPTKKLQVGVPGLSDLGHIQWPLHADLGRTEKDVLTGLKAIYDAAPRGEELKAVWGELDRLLSAI